MARSISVPVDFRNADWSGPNGVSGSFKPNRKSGPKLAYKTHPFLTPNSWDSEEEVWSARFFVGFNVGDDPKYDMEDLIKLVKRVRKQQTNKPDSTFIYQRGVFTHDNGKEVTENGAQVVLLNIDSPVPVRQFYRDMIQLGEVIREELEQETVILQVQKDGIVKRVIGIDKEGFDEHTEETVLDKIEIS